MQINDAATGNGAGGQTNPEASRIWSNAMRRVTLAAVLGLVGFTPLAASEEEHLVWQEVKITAPERKDTGKVVFSAKTDAEGQAYVSIEIEAFGKMHKVPKETLDKLAAYPLSGLATSHEAGYERLGGHTVHFKFKKLDFTADVPRESTMTLSVSKGRGVTLSGPSQKPLAAAN
jgi:hypothetical protein